MGGCRILDVPCGIGRVGIPLAQLGYTVPGLDFSPHLLSVAAAKAKRFGVAGRVSLTTGSMSDLTVFAKDSFDCAINVFTSIGYGSEQEDEAFFRQLRTVVRPGGLFVISGLRNRDYIVRHPAQNVFEESERLLVLDRYSFDVTRSREKGSWRFFLRVGERAEVRRGVPHRHQGLLAPRARLDAGEDRLEPLRALRLPSHQGRLQPGEPELRSRR